MQRRKSVTRGAWWNVTATAAAAFSTAVAVCSVVWAAEPTDRPPAAVTAAVTAAAEGDAAEPPLVVKVYNVRDLAMPRFDYPFQGMLVPGAVIGVDGMPWWGLGSGPSGMRGMGGLGGMGGGMMGSGGGMGGMGGVGGSGGGMGGMGGMGGGGGGMMGGGMGGGYFSVPNSVHRQAGAPAEGGGGAARAGEGGTPNFPGRQAGALGGTAGRGLLADYDSLINVISSTVEPESWQEVGGPGSIEPHDGMLIVNQTEAVHKKIAQLLDEMRNTSQLQRTVTVRARWLFLDLAQVGQLTRGAEKGIDRAALDALSSKAKGYFGAVSCFDGQAVHLISGRTRSLVVGAIPVVDGAGAPGYQPIVSNPQSGALLQVIPRILPDGKTAVLDVHSIVVVPEGWKEAGRGAAAGQWSAQPNDPFPPLDRANLVAQQFATTVRIPLAEPVLVGGMTFEPGAEPQETASSQLYLFVEVTAK